MAGNEQSILETCKVLAEIGCRGIHAYLGLTPTTYLAIITDISEDMTALDLVMWRDLVRDNEEGRQLVRLLNKVSERELPVNRVFQWMFWELSYRVKSHVPSSWVILYEQGIFSCKDEGIDDSALDELHISLLLGQSFASWTSFFRMFFTLGGSPETFVGKMPLLMQIMYDHWVCSFTNREEQNEAINSLVITISLFFEYGIHLSEESMELAGALAVVDPAFIGPAWIIACVLHGKQEWIPKCLKHTDIQDLGRSETSDASSECGSCTDEENEDVSDKDEDTVDETRVSQNGIPTGEEAEERHEQDENEEEHREIIEDENFIQRHDQRMPGAWIEDDNDSERVQRGPRRTHMCTLDDFTSTINGHFWDPDIYASNPNPEWKEFLDWLREEYG